MGGGRAALGGVHRSKAIFEPLFSGRPSNQDPVKVGPSKPSVETHNADGNGDSKPRENVQVGQRGR